MNLTKIVVQYIHIHNVKKLFSKLDIIFKLLYNLITCMKCIWLNGTDPILEKILSVSVLLSKKHNIYINPDSITLL